MKFHPLLPLLLTLTLTLTLTSCGPLKKDKEPEREKTKVTGPEKRVIGRIASVSHAGEFVLIQKFGPGALPKNTIYQSQGPEGRSASLRPSGERVRDFYAADLVSGHSKKGDAVVGYPDHRNQAETEKETTLPESVKPKSGYSEKPEPSGEKLLRLSKLSGLPIILKPLTSNTL